MPPFRFFAPTSRDHSPSTVQQPLALAWVCRTGWSFTADNTDDHISLIIVIVWQYPCEDLIVMDRLYQAVGWATVGGRTSKEVIAME